MIGASGPDRVADALDVGPVGLSARPKSFQPNLKAVKPASL
jgi:hypothetical protein